MSLTGFPISQFGGLNLTEDPQDVGPNYAIDLLNVDIDKHGRVRTRDGTVKLSTVMTGVGSTRGKLITSFSTLGVGATDKLVVVGFDGTNTSVYTITAAGVVALQGAWASTAGVFSLTKFGTPTNSYIFIAGEGITVLKRFDGAAIANSVGFPLFVAVSPRSNRLVQAGFANAASSPTGANGSPYTVFFSDAGVPETFSANNYIHLEPGDSDTIIGMAAWGDYLFVAKRRSLYVFYSESTSGTGTPIFNYRKIPLYDMEIVRPGIDVAIGLTVSSGSPLAAGVDGLYVSTTRGIYRTVGGPLSSISDAINPRFSDGVNHVNRGLSWANDKLAYHRPNDTTLVWDHLTGQWLEWSLPGSYISNLYAWYPDDGPLAAPSTAPARIYFVGDQGAGSFVYYLDPSITSDNGTAISARYQSGFYELSPTNQAKTRWTHLWGSGTPTFDIYTDHATSDPLTRGAAVTLGTSPAVAKGIHNKAYKGDLFSHKFSSTSGAWSVNRIQHDIAETSKP